MIIWIASYPKSGNTWLRAFLSAYLYGNNNKFDFSLLKKIPKFPHKKLFDGIVDIESFKKKKFEIVKYFIVAQQKLNLDNSIKLLKTHNAYVSYKNNWFSDEKNTKAYIYLVRDPRSVVLSLSSYQKVSVERATDLMLNQGVYGSDDEDDLMIDIRSSWKINYQSWKKKKDYNGIVVKFEDLIDNTEVEFEKILFFLKKIIKINIDKNKILKSVNACQFLKLSKMEDAHGFDEAAKNKFFRKGKKDSWKNELSKDLRKKIEENLEDEMNELGYL